MGIFADYVGKLDIPEEKRSEYARQMLTLLHAGGMLSVDGVGLFGRRIQLFYPPELGEDHCTRGWYNYFEDDCWGPWEFNADAGIFCPDKIGSGAFHTVVVAANILTALYSKNYNIVAVDGEYIREHKYIGWLNSVLGTQYTNWRTSVMYASGARAQEMCNLTVADVRFDKEAATLTLKGKGGKYRHIGIPTAPAKILKQYIVFREIDRRFDEFVFPSQTHAQMTVSCVEGIFKKYISLARKRHPDLFRAKSYSPHSMRHSTATHMLEAGVPLIVIKNFLGHSSLQTTQVYAAVSQCTLNKHIQDWNKKWFSDNGSLEHQLKAEIPSFLI